MTLNYREDILLMEDVPLTELAAAIGTPTYAYSRQYLTDAIERLQAAFAATPTKIHYAVKANSNIAILRLMSELGCGFDIVSGGELTRVINAGGDASDVIFSGDDKSIEEIDYALKLGIHCFNVESEQELWRIRDRANNLGLVAPISMRVNPNVDAKTHPYISTGLKENKFGIDIQDALNVYDYAKSLDHLHIKGVDCHIGSQLIDTQPLIAALKRMLRLIDELEQRDITIEHLDLGGGLGVNYGEEIEPSITDYVHTLVEHLQGRSFSLALEPGR